MSQAPLNSKPVGKPDKPSVSKDLVDHLRAVFGTTVRLRRNKLGATIDTLATLYIFNQGEQEIIDYIEELCEQSVVRGGTA